MQYPFLIKMQVPKKQHTHMIQIKHTEKLEVDIYRNKTTIEKLIKLEQICQECQNTDIAVKNKKQLSTSEAVIQKELLFLNTVTGFL